MTDASEQSVLIVDDDAIDVKALRRAFAQCGWTGPLATASNGREALEYLEKCQRQGDQLPRLVLLDINMPLMNGIEFLGALRTSDLPANMPVVMLSTSCENYVVNQAFNLGAAGFFEKPRGLDMLQEVVDTIGGYWKRSHLPSGSDAYT